MTTVESPIKDPPRQPPYKGHSLVRDKDNLSTEDKVADPKVSFIGRFHCTIHDHVLHRETVNADGDNDRVIKSDCENCEATKKSDELNQEGEENMERHLSGTDTTVKKPRSRKTKFK